MPPEPLNEFQEDMTDSDKTVRIVEATQHDEGVMGTTTNDFNARQFNKVTIIHDDTNMLYFQ